MNKNCDSIGKYISILYRMSGTYFAKEFKRLNIGRGQYMFLAFLYEREGVNQEELSHYLSMDKGTTARALKKLEEVGYISRIEDDKDRRAYRVFITPKGMSIKEEFFSILQGWNDNLINELKPEEIQTLKTLLKKIILLNIQEDFHG